MSVRPEPRIVSFDLPDKIDGTEGLLSVHEALLRGTAIGGIALEDARDISSMLETHRRLVETGAKMKFRNSLAMSTFLASPRITTTLVNSFGKIPIVQRLPIAP